MISVEKGLRNLSTQRTASAEVAHEESSEEEEAARAEEEQRGEKGLYETIRAGAVTVTAQDTFVTVLSKLKRLRGVPGNMKVVGFSFR